MFTGIIADIGTITKAEKNGDLRLTVACSKLPLPEGEGRGEGAESEKHPLPNPPPQAGEGVIKPIKLGDSIACSGVCLTVVEILPDGFAAELSAETVSCSAEGMWHVGKKLNLERALKMGDSLDGHIVSGHVDGVAVIQSIEKSGDSSILTIAAPDNLAKFIAKKGSVALDGISLTVNSVENNIFSVNIIPHTWQNTCLQYRKPGDLLNLEIDMLARYVSRLLEK